MGVTGVLIWFKIDVTKYLPRWAVDVSVTVHYYEAILACLAIVVWHFYHVIFDPDVYPLNMACMDGNVSEHWHKEEHELDTKARNVVPAEEISLHEKRGDRDGGEVVTAATGNGNGKGHTGNGHGRS
jgi:cytochrome b subunit of formate dehydrogenase